MMRKGQAAMEYLMTYGWAILIVLAIMGILVYLVRPQQVESCNVALPFQCEQNKYTINSSQILKLSLVNLGSIAYNITTAKCGSSTTNLNTVITPGSNATLNISCAGSTNIIPSSQVQPGKDVFKDTISITYYPVGSPEFQKTQQIEIVVKYS
jgi:hypothetical protein